MKSLTIINRKGQAIFEAKAQSELHIVCKYVDKMLNQGKAITDDTTPTMIVDNDTLQIVEVNFESMVFSLFTINESD